MYHSDKAIQEFDEDLLGRATFARQLAHSVLSIDLADSFAIGIYGKWGTGKTSVLNMMQKEINANTQTKTNLHLANFGGVEVLSSIQMNPGWVHHGPTGSTHSKETLEQRKTVILHELYWL